MVLKGPLLLRVRPASDTSRIRENSLLICAYPPLSFPQVDPAYLGTRLLILCGAIYQDKNKTIKEINELIDETA